MLPETVRREAFSCRNQLEVGQSSKDSVTVRVFESLTMPWIPLLLLHDYSSVPLFGKWTASTDFGILEFTVNTTGTGITKITYGFSNFSCGGIPISGIISNEQTPPWPIDNRQFTIESTLDPGVSEITIRGTFDTGGKHASGEWEVVVPGKNCAGTWVADSSGS